MQIQVKSKVWAVVTSLIISWNFLNSEGVHAQLALIPASNKSGADCNAANLPQALLGISTNQHGIVNNADIPLFIVCSVDMVFNILSPDVVLEALFPPNGGTIQCSYRVGLRGRPGFASASVVIESGVDSTAPPPGAINQLRGIDSINSENGQDTLMNLVQLGLNHTVVCALDPGEGIADVSVF